MCVVAVVAAVGAAVLVFGQNENTRTVGKRSVTDLLTGQAQHVHECPKKNCQRSTR